MAWSYRNDRSDEIYSTNMGPGAAEVQTIPRPPAAGEDLEDVMNPPKPKEGEVPPDSEAGPIPPTAEEQVKINEATVKRDAELAKVRVENEEKARVRAEIRHQKESEAKEKDIAKVREDVEKEVAAQEKAQAKENKSQSAK